MLVVSKPSFLSFQVSPSFRLFCIPSLVAKYNTLGVGGVQLDPADVRFAKSFRQMIPMISFGLVV